METVPDLPGLEMLASDDARAAYCDLLQSLHAIIHVEGSTTQAAFESLIRLGESWAVRQALTGVESQPLPLSTAGERDVIQTLLAIARYTQTDDAALAELADAFRFIATDV